MICPKCQFEQVDFSQECLRCGLIFEKYRKAGHAASQQEQSTSEDDTVQGQEKRLIKALLFEAEPDIRPLHFVGRLIIFLFIFIWGWRFILSPLESNSAANSFLHLINLPFHEAGHIFFRPFGRFMTSLGGSLGQLMMPFICLVVFLVRTRDPFAASVSLWWFAENLMDIAPYINDARAGKLPLLGGNTGRNSPYGFHDWEFILNEAGCLRFDHTLAQFTYHMGIAVMLVSFLWAGYMLIKQYRSLHAEFRSL
jgi:hypothetical protein